MECVKESSYLRFQGDEGFKANSKSSEGNLFSDVNQHINIGYIFMR